MLKYSVVLISFIFLFIGCGEKTDKPANDLSGDNKFTFDSTNLKTEGIDQSGKPFLMEYKFKKGDKHLYRVTSISKNTQKLEMDTTITSGVDQKIVYLIDFEVKDVDKDGTTEAELKINSIKLNAEVNKEKFEFETEKDTDSSKLVQFAEYHSLHNNPFSVTFNKKGEVMEVFRAEKISNKFLELKGAADTISANDRNSIRQDIIAGILAPLVTQIIRKLSDKEVYKDSTWELKQAPVSMMVYQINYVNKYKVENVEKLDDHRIAVIDASISFDYKGQSKISQGNVTYNFDKPKSTAEGKIYFDVDQGLQLKSRTKTSMQLNYSMEANTPQGKQKGSRSDLVTNTNIVELIK